MANLRSSGVYADRKSGGGLFRGIPQVPPTADVPGIPLDVLSRRTHSGIFHDFIEDDLAQWTLTNASSGTGVTDTLVANGILDIDCPTDNEGVVSLQVTLAANAEAVLVPAANRVIVYETLLQIDDVSQADWFIGFAEIDTAFMATNGTLGADGTNNMVGFHHLVNDGGVPSLTMNATAGTIQNTELSAGVNLAGKTVTHTISDATDTRFGIRISGAGNTAGGVEYYIDEKLVHVDQTTVAFDTAMTPTFCLIGGASAAEMRVDYVLAYASR